MTIHYDPQDHLGVLFALKGSVWQHVFFPCSFNAILTLAVYFLKENYGLVGISISDKGHTFLSVLAAFLVITRFTITYNNVWSCRGIVNDMFHAARRISSKIAVFTKNDDGVNAQKYRDLIKLRLLELVGSTTFIITDHAMAVNIIQGVDLKKVKTEKQVRLREKKLSSGEDETMLNELEDPMVLCLNLHAAIISHADYLSEPIHILREMNIAQQVNTYMASYHSLVKASSTPFPFPLVQMAFTLIDIWLYTLPFALSSDIKNKFACAAIIFFITFGFRGLERIATELQDPFGKDENDFDMNKYRDDTANGISKDLEKRFTTLDDWAFNDNVSSASSHRSSQRGSVFRWENVFKYHNKYQSME